jgi:hypothetical protein
MTPFEDFYGRKCNTPMSLDNLAYRAIIELYLLSEMEENMEKVRHNLKVAKDN